MNTTIEVYVGAPIEVESERRFLSTLCADLQARGHDALVLANFLLPPHNPINQIDFLVILKRLACHIELKNLTAPVAGEVNGTWHLQLPDGTKKPLHANPYRQALNCKYAISDQMHRLAKRQSSLVEPPNGTKFFKHFESIVCIYPDLIGGSKVPSDKLVGVHGYPALLEFLRRTERNPAWTWQDWTSFAMELGLVRREELAEAATDSITNADNLVESYCQRFRDYHGPSTANLVPTSLELRGQKTDSRECLDLFAKGRHCQLVGASGSGKSLHVECMAVKSLDAGRIPIIARAIDYTGKLTTLLDRSIAHFCPRTATVFIEAVRRLGRPLTLIVDGFNECPMRLKDRLTQDMQAAFLRWEIPIVITTQEELSLPQNLCGDNFRFCELNDNERRAIIAKYAPEELPTEVELLCKPFRSAFELRLAASCFAELATNPTRASLYDAFLRHRCCDLLDPALVRRLLSEVADAMRGDLRSSLPIDQVWRIGERVLDDQKAPLTTLQAIISCGLIEVRQGQCVFRHELLQRYFEAIALVRATVDLSKLSEALRKPVHYALIEFVLGMQTEPAGVRACLNAAANANSLSHLFSDCLHGRFGDTARSVVINDAETTIKYAKADLSQFDLDLILSESDEPIGFQIVHAREWTGYERALINAIAHSLPSGLFFDEVFLLIQETENSCIDRLEKKCGVERVMKRSFRSDMFWYLIIGSVSQELPATAIVRALDGQILSDTSQIVIHRIRDELSQNTGLSILQLYLILSFLRYSAIPYDQDVAIFILNCWNSGVYNLRLKMLDCVLTWRSLPMSDETRNVIVDALSQTRTSNPFLGAQWVETMRAYDLIGPIVDPAELTKDVAEIVTRPNDPEAWESAYGVVSNTFESMFDDTFYQTIESLQPNERTTLFVMAALGLPPHSTCGDYILSRLLEVDDIQTLPAFQRNTKNIVGEAFCRQDSDICFVLGHIGCAKYLQSPPRLEDTSTDDLRAWQCYGELIFWSSKSGMSAEKRRATCEPIWKTLSTTLAFEAVDPLWRIVHAFWKGHDNPVQRLFSVFRDEIRLVLEYGMRHREQLSAIDKRFPADMVNRELTTFMVHTLGQIGNADSVAVLLPLVDHNYHGQDAVDAIRRLNSSQRADRVGVLHRSP